MAALDPNLVLNAMREAVEFTRRVGNNRHAASLEQVCNRLEQEKITLKAASGVAAEEMNQTGIALRGILYDDQRNARPGMELLVREHERIWIDFLRAIYPPEFAEKDITGFSGSEAVESKMVRYKGDPAGVQRIVERSISIIRDYSRAVGSGDFIAAYALTDRGLRGWMTYKRFVGDHERAAQDYGGPALEFLIQGFHSILADDKVRRHSNTSAEGWPKGTVKENRRAGIGGFWIRDRAARTGCGGTLWIAEENDAYRIAKFNFWIP
jgi:hypothetical protein